MTDGSIQGYIKLG